MKQYEIEIKLPVKNSQEVLDILKDIGFMVKKEIQEEDTYFNSEYRNIKERDEALRIRKSRDCDIGEQKVQINFKGPKIDAVSMSRMELETEVQDGETMEKILTYLGFLPVASVCKVRKYLTHREMTACVDRVEGLGEFLELEVVAETEEKREIYLEQMKEILNALGYSMEDTVRTSYLGLLMKKKMQVAVRR